MGERRYLLLVFLAFEELVESLIDLVILYEQLLFSLICLR